MPLASGLLTGQFDRGTAFAPDDHRAFNRHGEQFDVGETFAGVDYELGLDVVDELRALVPEGATLAQLALRWILTFDAVSTVIPGAKTAEQAQANAAASDLPPPSRMRCDGSRSCTASGSRRRSTSGGRRQPPHAAPSTAVQT